MYCQSCGRNAPTKYFEFYQNIGMLVIRTMRTIKGNMCKSCARRHFWEMTGLTLVTGWWGLISFVLNWVFIIQNIARVCATFGMADGSSGSFPVQPDVRVPPVRPPVQRSPSDTNNPYRQL